MITFTKKIILYGLSNAIPTYIYLKTHLNNPITNIRYLTK